MRAIDINALVDQAKFNAFHWRVLFWCALIIIFDGYDLVIYGVVLPALMQEWGLTPLQAGALGSYALFGMMFGALVFGPLFFPAGSATAQLMAAYPELPAFLAKKREYDPRELFTSTFYRGLKAAAGMA